MPDNLRDRIAAVLTDALADQAKNDYYSRFTPIDDEGDDLPPMIGLDATIDPAKLADAVIEALALKREHLSGRDSLYVIAGDPRPIHRYVTDWLADE